MVKPCNSRNHIVYGTQESGLIRDSIRFGDAAADTKAQDLRPADMLILELAASLPFSKRWRSGLASDRSDCRVEASSPSLGTFRVFGCSSDELGYID